MPAAVVDGDPWRRKARIGECPNGDAHRRVVSFFGVEDRRSANRAEAEYELRSLISDANVFGGSSGDFERGGEACERREYAAGPLLAGKAVAYAHASRLALDLYAQLSAGT